MIVEPRASTRLEREVGHVSGVEAISTIEFSQFNSFMRACCSAYEGKSPGDEKFSRFCSFPPLNSSKFPPTPIIVL